MFFANRKYNNLLNVIILLSIPHLPIKANNLPFNGMAAHKQETFSWDILVDTTQQQLESLHGILSDLSAIINEKQTKIANKGMVISNIKQMMRDVEYKKNMLAVNTNKQIVYEAIEFVQKSIKHISGALKKNLQDFPSFTYEPNITRKKEISPTDLEYTIRSNHKSLNALKQNSNNAGLSWYNKVYRTLDMYLLQYIAAYGKNTFCAVAGATYLWWHYAKSPFLVDTLGLGRPFDPFEKRSKDEPHHNNDNDKAATKLGKIEELIAEYWKGLLPLGSLLLWIYGEDFNDKWTYEIKPSLEKKIMATHYRLMGGAYVARADKLDEIKAEVTFDDLVGLDHVKEYFKLLVDYLENPEIYDRRKLTPQKGCLLIGPTRTGKTHSVSALYGEIKRMLKRTGQAEKFTFIEIPAASLNDPKRGGIRRWMYVLKAKAPCIAFIDEIDLLNLERIEGQKNIELSDFLTALSGTLDEIDPQKQVIIIAATNRPKSLDVALKQPGRFGKRLYFEYPDLNSRKTYIVMQLKKLSLDLHQFDIDKIAVETEGHSYADLKTLTDTAVLKARIAGQSVAQHHLQAALDEEIRHILPNTKAIPNHEKEIIATHFAGHALALHLLDAYSKLAQVTINPVMACSKEEFTAPDDQSAKQLHNKEDQYDHGSIFIYHDEDSINIMSEKEQLKQCKLELAGFAAEKIMFGSCGYSCHKKDKEKALSIAMTLACEGITPSSLPKHIQKQKYNEALELLVECEKEITVLLEEHKDTLENIIIELQTCGTLTSEDIAEIIEDTESSIDIIKEIEEEADLVDVSREQETNDELDLEQLA
jgi:cell division protease FtsH